MRRDSTDQRRTQSGDREFLRARERRHPDRCGVAQAHDRSELALAAGQPDARATRRVGRARRARRRSRVRRELARVRARGLGQPSRHVEAARRERRSRARGVEPTRAGDRTGVEGSARSRLRVRRRDRRRERQSERRKTPPRRARSIRAPRPAGDALLGARVDHDGPPAPAGRHARRLEAHRAGREAPLFGQMSARRRHPKGTSTAGYSSTYSSPRQPE